MKQRFLLQLLAIVLSLVLIVVLVLVGMGKIPAMAFWVTAGIVFALTYVLYKK